MQYVKIDDSGVYQGMVSGIPGDIPGSYFSPEGVKVSPLGPPPTDEPGKWRETPEGWREVAPEEQQAALIAAFMAGIQSRLDSFARSRTYDDARACVSVYLGCSNETFAAEAAYMQAQIVATWEWSNAYVNGILQGENPMPESWEAFEAELAAAVPLEWPVPDTRVTAALGGE